MKIYVDVQRTLTDQIYLVGADPWFEFKDGHRTDNLLGARANLVIPLQKFEKVNVKIAGAHAGDLQKLVEDAGGAFVSVRLIEPTATVYMMNGKMGISVTAKNVEVVK